MQPIITSSNSERTRTMVKNGETGTNMAKNHQLNEVWYKSMENGEQNMQERMSAPVTG